MRLAFFLPLAAALKWRRKHHKVRGFEVPLEIDPVHVPLFVKWEDHFKDITDLNFVQIGANCGTNTVECARGGDPVWEYATRFNWQGVVIEPVPRIFGKLQTNYADYKGVKPMQAMISDHDGIGLIEVKGEESSEFTPTTPGTFGNGGVIMAKRRTANVPVLTLPSLWKKVQEEHKLKKIHMLVVDAEGNELKILGGEIPKPLPQTILFEIAHMENSTFDNIDQNLKKHGYHLVEKLKHMDKVGLTYPPQDALYSLKK